MRTFVQYGLIAGLLGIASSVYAQTASIPTDSMIVEIIMTALQSVSGQVTTRAMQWLSALMALQFVITNYKLIPQAELDTVFAKFVGSLAWFGVCWYILAEGPEFVNRVGNSLFNNFAPNIPSASGIVASTVGVTTAMLVVAAAVGAANTTMGQAVLYFVLCVGGIGMYFAIKLFLIQLELVLVVVLSPISYALLGLNALRDQGIAPLKSLLSLAYRIIIYGVLYGAFTMIGNAMITVAQKYGSSGDILSLIGSGWTMMKVLVAGVFSYAILLGLLYKSDAIAASLSSGATNMGSADVAGAAMAGAAAGALMQGAVNAAGQPAQRIQDMAGKLFGREGVGMNNASTEGMADLNAAVLKPEPVSASLMDTAGSSNGTGRGNDRSSRSAPVPGSSNGLEFGGVPNSSPSDTGGRDSARDAAREARRQERSGSGKTAGIEGDLSKQVGDLVNAMNNPKEKGVGQRLGEWHQQVGQERASTHVSINTHHHD